MPTTELETERETVRDMVVRYAEKYEGPTEIAAAIIDDLIFESVSIRLAFAEILPSYCGQVLGQQRRRSIELDVPPAGSARSAKVEAIRAWFPNFLASQLHTANGWKRLGDCTTSDLMFSAAERRTEAAQTLHRAAELEALAAALAAHKKKTLSHLPESVVRSAIASVR